jgi:curved DNA-binding protein CbpA
MEDVLEACPAGARQGARLVLIASWFGALAPEEGALGSGSELASLDGEVVAAVRLAVSQIVAAETHFQVLGLEWDAPSDDFRTSFFGLARMLHPDRLGSFPEELRLEAEDAFNRARQAWEIVGDPNSRRAYTDHAIHGKKTEDEIAREEMEAIFAAESDFKRGLVAFNAGQIRVAQRDFETAVRQDPGEPEYKMYLGYTNFRVNRTTNTEAAERGRQMLMDVVDAMKERLSAAGDKPPPRLTDLSSRSWTLMGRVYRDQADSASGEEETQVRAAAKRCFLQALRVSPSNADAQRELKRMKAERDKESKGFFGSLFGRSKKR